MVLFSHWSDFSYVVCNLSFSFPLQRVATGYERGNGKKKSRGVAVSPFSFATSGGGISGILGDVFLTSFFVSLSILRLLLLVFCFT